MSVASKNLLFRIIGHGGRGLVEAVMFPSKSRLFGQFRLVWCAQVRIRFGCREKGFFRWLESFVECLDLDVGVCWFEGVLGFLARALPPVRPGRFLALLSLGAEILF